MSLKEDFDRYGYCIERGACESSAVMWRDYWNIFYDPDRDLRWNKVEVVGPFPHPLSEIPRHPRLVQTATLLLGAPVACYNHRLLVKDARSGGPVFAHQDIGYHVGSSTKLSAFVALSEVNSRNGGLRLWPGTHRYGYLGDVGALNLGALPQETVPVCDDLEPGDALFMNSALWHDSTERTGGPIRVLADVIYERADEPARALPKQGLFLRSRVSRIQELEEENKSLREALVAWQEHDRESHR